MSQSTSPPERSTRNSRRRPQVSYRELDDLSEEDISELTSSHVRRQIHAPTRRSHRSAASRPSYNEQSSTEASSESSEEGSEEETRRPIKRQRYSPHKEQIRASSSRSVPSSPKPNSRPQSRRQKPALQVEKKTQTIQPSSQNCPPWQTLPYHILRLVFEYASYPLFESAVRPSQSIYWLLDTSRLCRSFHEAAIAALIRSPPLYPLYRARDLLRLLRKSQEALSMNYQNKIHKLDVEVKHLLVKKRPIELPAMIKLAPQLKDLRLYHHHDEMGVTLWSRPSATSKSTKWDYDPAIFDALDGNNIQLRSFEWNGRFSNSNKVIEDMAKWHERECFQRLEFLTLLNLSTSDKAAEQEEGKYEKLLMEAISRLPSIKHLSFQNCTVVNDRLFQRMPIGLESLTVVDCVSLTSSEMSAFLRDKGMSLTELRLDANQSLDLAFADNLAASCPKLQVFSMDLTYYDASAYHDVEPYFEQLLPTGPPTWPSSLQVIDLAQLRSWDMAAADAFFQSLEDAAPMLPDLRYLSLKAILKSGWRDRAELRKKWKTRLEKIFLRRWEEPSDNRTVVHRHAEKAEDVDAKANDEQTISNAPSLPLFPNLVTSDDTEPLQEISGSSEKTEGQSTRKSSRIPVVVANREEALRRESAIAAAEAEKANARREAMIAAKKAAAKRAREETNPSLRSRKRAISATEGDFDDLVDNKGDIGGDDLNVSFIQGLCTTVLFRVDDQRPADAQFNEADFVDEEMSGDEDWNGKDVDFEEEWVRKKGRGRKYAW